jgi:hypothetical protein
MRGSGQWRFGSLVAAWAARSVRTARSRSSDIAVPSGYAPKQLLIGDLRPGFKAGRVTI